MGIGVVIIPDINNTDSIVKMGKYTEIETILLAGL